VVPCFWFPKATGFGARITLLTTPVPVNAVCCGLPGASSATITVGVRAPPATLPGPARAPSAPGFNVTLITHEPPFAVSTKLATHVVVPPTIAKSPLFAPVIVTGVPAVSVAFNVPLFVTVIVCAALVVPCFWFPKATGFGARITLLTTPVPVNAVCCGLPGASSATLTVAVRAPAAPGVNVTLITQDPPFAVSTKPATHVVVPPTIAKSPLFAPVIVTGVPAAKVEFNVPVFVTVIVCAALVVPCFWFPKATGFGANPTLASTPVPVNVVCCGLAGASSATLTVAVRAPAAPGVNVTLITHEPAFAVSTKPATHV